MGQLASWRCIRHTVCSCGSFSCSRKLEGCSAGAFSLLDVKASLSHTQYSDIVWQTSQSCPEHVCNALSLQAYHLDLAHSWVPFFSSDTLWIEWTVEGWTHALTGRQTGSHLQPLHHCIDRVHQSFPNMSLPSMEKLAWGPAGTFWK